MFIEIDSSNVRVAAAIRALSWQASHRSFCTPEFVALHDAVRQEAHLRNELSLGKRIWLLVESAPLGLVSVDKDLIENLYVLPSAQRMGCGTRLLRFAMSQCISAPRLWLLSNNAGAHRLYLHEGFLPTGGRHVLTDTLFELEMRCERQR